MDISEKELIDLLREAINTYGSQFKLAQAIFEKLQKRVTQSDISAYACSRKRISVAVAEFLGYELRKERIFKPIEGNSDE